MSQSGGAAVAPPGDLNNAAPPGFAPLPVSGAFLAINGPILYRRDDTGFVFGFRVEAHHANLIGTCHGGWLSAVADMTLVVGARMAAGLEASAALTVSLSLDYFGSAQVGQWVECRPELVKRTRKLLFAETVLTVDGQPIVRASGIFRIGPDVQPLNL